MVWGFGDDVYVGSILIDFYGKCKEVLSARKIFDEMSDRNAVSWTPMIVGYANVRDLENANRVFDRIQERRLPSRNAMIAMIDGYAKAGDMVSVRALFDEALEKDNVVWTELISGYSQNVEPNEAVKIFLELVSMNILTPSNYAPLIVFYVKREANADATQFIAYLKKSMSEILSVLYTFSGRVKDNMFVDHFDEGAPLMEAQVNCSLSEFLDDPEIESLNKFLPRQPFTKQLRDDLPLIVFQVSLFSCGGIALGCCMSHKFGDGATAAIFFSVGAAISCGSPRDEIALPNLNNAALMFPPRNQLPQNNVSLLESIWFEEGNYVTRRFVFDHKAIGNPKEQGQRGKHVSSSPRPCFFRQAVNLRPRIKSGLLDGAIGNLFWCAE
ncbi:unnamed protein product [Dovyalis caffra]|uniref:Uncharacterized protein n=1 Tax=Dovyalis caffra TaxID=77055 RepID=A0AAV1QWC5_9ROSI|nr:unnamed protein product [Dovyalis caffra]